MGWLFETICPKCLKGNSRYWLSPHQSHPFPQGQPECLGVTCECGFGYIAVNNQVDCLGCQHCIWSVDRGFTVKVINTYEVVE